jgi:hypothetical protein
MFWPPSQCIGKDDSLHLAFASSGAVLTPFESRHLADDLPHGSSTPTWLSCLQTSPSMPSGWPGDHASFGETCKPTNSLPRHLCFNQANAQQNWCQGQPVDGPVACAHCRAPNQAPARLGGVSHGFKPANNTKHSSLCLARANPKHRQNGPHSIARAVAVQDLL